MIDLLKSIELSDLPDILVFSDDRMPGAYYAFPESPRLAGCEHGKAQLRLMLYGVRTGEAFEPMTGFVSCTTTLALTLEENDRIRTDLEKHLAGSAAQGSTVPSLRLLNPDWREGRVELRLTPELRLTGRPSLFGANQCSFSRSLEGIQLGEFVTAWRSGLNDALITYELGMSTGSQTDSTWRYDEEVKKTSAGATHRSRLSIGVEQTQHVPNPVSLTLSGLLGLSVAELVASISEVDQGRARS